MLCFFQIISKFKAIIFRKMTEVTNLLALRNAFTSGSLDVWNFDL
jgi:hypothetical protein